MSGLNNSKVRRYEKTVTMMERGLAPEFQRVYSELPLVINLPVDMVWVFKGGMAAGRAGLPEVACPPELCPVHRAMWFDGRRVAITHTGPVIVRECEY